MAESERVGELLLCFLLPSPLTFIQYLPLLIDKVEKICEENGLRNDSIVLRLTGCPNGCARTYVAGPFHLCSNFIPSS
jgi:hypothetical protein